MKLDPVAFVRTGAAAAGLTAAAGLGMASGVVNRSRRDAANLAFSAGSDLALTLGGVRLRVTGAEHLWSVRPAVFVFNHQSALDAIRNTGELMRRGSPLLRPGVVDVAVLEPNDPAEWPAGDLAKEVAAVRQTFIDTLADWPEK